MICIIIKKNIGIYLISIYIPHSHNSRIKVQLFSVWLFQVLILYILFKLQINWYKKLTYYILTENIYTVITYNPSSLPLHICKEFGCTVVQPAAIHIILYYHRYNICINLCIGNTFFNISLYVYSLYAHSLLHPIHVHYIYIMYIQGYNL